MDDLAKDAANIHGMPKATHSALRVENMLYLEDVNCRISYETIQDPVATERTARFHYHSEN